MACFGGPFLRSNFSGGDQDPGTHSPGLPAAGTVKSKVLMVVGALGLFLFLSRRWKGGRRRRSPAVGAGAGREADLRGAEAGPLFECLSGGTPRPKPLFRGFERRPAGDPTGAKVQAGGSLSARRPVRWRGGGGHRWGRRQERKKVLCLPTHQVELATVCIPVKTVQTVLPP